MKLDKDTVRKLKEQGILPADFPEDVKPAKYRNRKVTVDGVTYDSEKEYKRWLELRLLEKFGGIRNLERQVPYRLEVKGVLVCTYRADAVYFDVATGRVVVEDTKSEITQKHPVYRIKAKLMLAIYNITILEV